MNDLHAMLAKKKRGRLCASMPKELIDRIYLEANVAESKVSAVVEALLREGLRAWEERNLLTKKKTPRPKKAKASKKPPTIKGNKGLNK